MNILWMQLKDFYGLAGELGRTTITIVAITIGGFLSIILVTLMIVGIITVTCCFAVRSDRKGIIRAIGMLMS